MNDLIIKIYIMLISFYLGSFFVLVGVRLPKGESIFKPRSHCANCETRLKWLDIIPVFSYINLKGRCRHCYSRIGIISLIVEVLTPLLFGWFIFNVEFNSELLVGLIFLSLLIIISVSDVLYKIVPDSVILFFLIILFISRLYVHPDGLLTYILGSLIGFLFLYLIAYFGLKIFKKPVLGGGDIKLYAIIGLVVGYKLVLMSLFLASFLGSIIGFSLMQFKIISKDDYIPFVPFIAFGALITYLYGNLLMEWYLHLFL